MGTWQTNRKGFPDELKDFSDRKVPSTETFFQENGPLRITSYVAKGKMKKVDTSKKKKKKDEEANYAKAKLITILSTFEPHIGLTVDDLKEKPCIIKVYDFTKGGTDVMDPRIGVYSTKTKSNKWKKVVWHYIIDTTRVNCQTLLLVTNPDVYGLNKHRKPKVTSFEFGVELAKSLIMPWLQMRSLVGLTTYVRNAAYNFSDLPRYLTTAVAPTAVQFPHDSMSSKGLLEGYPRHRVFRQ